MFLRKMPNVKSDDWIRNFCTGGEEITVMNREVQEITFAAGTTGAIATKELFAVSGLVLCTVFGVCTTSLTGSGTICVGTEDDSDLIIDAATGTSIDAGDVFVDESAIGESEEWLGDFEWILSNGRDLVYEVESATLTAGTIRFYCFWYALSSGATVVPSGSNAAA